MNRFFFLFICLVSCLQLKAQETNEVSILTGHMLRVKPLDSALRIYGYDRFYQKSNLQKPYADDHYHSKYESLANKVFRVVGYEAYTDIIGNHKFKIKLNSTESGDIFYDYDPKHPTLFPFVFEDTAPEGFYCRTTKMDVDKFTGDTTYNTPYASGVSFMKAKKQGHDVVYMAVNVAASSLVIGKGFYALLQNNKRLNRPDAEIKVSASGGSYVYSALIALTKDDINLLSENQMTDVRLYLHDDVIRDAGQIIQYLKCVVAK